MIRSGLELPKPTVALAFLLWTGVQSGCFLIGYDGLNGAPHQDGSASDSAAHDGSAGNWESDGALDGDEAGPDDDASAPRSDGGQGADASVGDGGPGGAWWKDIAPETKCGGLPGVCAQICMTGAGRCVFACNSIGSCGSTCQAHTKCRATCDGLAVCSHTCGMGADCSYESRGTQTTASCEPGSTCDVTCSANTPCNLTCAPGASCSLRCQGLTCGMNCTGVKLTCADGSQVCDRKCPEDAGP